AQRQQQDHSGGEDGVLPGLAEVAGEGDGRAEDGTDGGGPGAVEEGAGPAVAAEAAEPPGAEQHEREGRGEGDRRGEQAPGEPGGGVADGGDGLDDRTW